MSEEAMGWSLSSSEQMEYLRKDIRKLKAENAKLRELCADMLMCLTWHDEPHGYMADGCDHCRFGGKTSGMCGLGMFKGRARELGVEVKP